jgi:hypothetical protein
VELGGKSTKSMQSRGRREAPKNLMGAAVGVAFEVVLIVLPAIY